MIAVRGRHDPGQMRGEAVHVIAQLDLGPADHHQAVGEVVLLLVAGHVAVSGHGIVAAAGDVHQTDGLEKAVDTVAFSSHDHGHRRIFAVFRRYHDGRHEAEARVHLVDELQTGALPAGGVDAADHVFRRDLAHVGIDVACLDRAAFGDAAPGQTGQQAADGIHAVVGARLIGGLAQLILQLHGTDAAVGQPGGVLVQGRRAEGQAFVRDLALVLFGVENIDADHGRAAVEREVAVDQLLQAVVAEMVGIPAHRLHELVVAVKKLRHVDGAGLILGQRMHRGRAHGEDDRAVHGAGGQDAGGLLGGVDAVTVSGGCHVIFLLLPGLGRRALDGGIGIVQGRALHGQQHAGRGQFRHGNEQGAQLFVLFEQGRQLRERVLRGTAKDRARHQRQPERPAGPQIHALRRVHGLSIFVSSSRPRDGQT